MKLNVICYALLGVALLASLFSLHPVWMWLLLANLLTFLIYGGDKLAAQRMAAGAGGDAVAVRRAGRVVGRTGGTAAVSPQNPEAAV